MRYDFEIILIGRPTCVFYFLVRYTRYIPQRNIRVLNARRWKKQRQFCFGGEKNKASIIGVSFSISGHSDILFDTVAVRHRNWISECYGSAFLYWLFNSNVMPRRCRLHYNNVSGKKKNHKQNSDRHLGTNRCCTGLSILYDNF